MKSLIVILSLALLSLQPSVGYCRDAGRQVHLDMYGNGIDVTVDASIIVPFDVAPTQQTVQAFYDAVNEGKYQPLIDKLLAFKEEHQLSDWIYYQLIRKTAQQIAPKAVNYERYTLYKWFLLAKSGYDVGLAVGDSQLTFYVRNDEPVYDIPYYIKDGKQYVCLNIHDYINYDIKKTVYLPINVEIQEGKNAFTYKVTQMPEFKPDNYSEKVLSFSYGQKDYHFKVKVNPQVQTIFNNYPVVDYASYFNIPLSNETYASLIPVLQNSVRKMSQKKGVDFLMHFTRNAFLYEEDHKNFGKEKRLSPEQTLLYQYSDCDDRAALFFYLVKEVYNLPMIALVYPTHITIAVKFDDAKGGNIEYKGNKYTICEPTPQQDDLRIGQLSPDLKNASYEVAYAYDPQGKD